MHHPISITKATGERELFDPQKLRRSLLRTKAKSDIVEKILSHIEGELSDGISTREIYNHAFDLLAQAHKPAAISYSMRNAIADLGPTGFPFENLIAEIFRTKGYETITDFMATGQCVEHEVDVVAWNKDKLIMVEAKFHNEFGLKSDLKVVLYVKARWDDLGGQDFDFGRKRKIDEGWLVTNTKFTDQAIKYAECKNMKLVGWNYPENGNLQDLIEDSKLHPITSLRSISNHDKKNLMQVGIIHLKQALQNLDILRQANLSPAKITEMFEEIALIQNS